MVTKSGGRIRRKLAEEASGGKGPSRQLFPRGREKAVARERLGPGKEVWGGRGLSRREALIGFIFPALL